MFLTFSLNDPAKALAKKEILGAILSGDNPENHWAEEPTG
jgi:hypothetical protein